MRPRSRFGNRGRHATREGRDALRADRRSTVHPEIDDDLVVTVDDQIAGHRRPARQRCVGAMTDIGGRADDHAKFPLPTLVESHTAFPAAEEEIAPLEDNLAMDLTEAGE
jgi:hypothetical protein